MAMPRSLVLGAVLLAFACTSCRSTRRPEPIRNRAATSNAEQQIRKAIDNYVAAMERGDPQLWESLFWLDDPALSIVENDRPHLLGRKYIDFLTGLIRKQGPHPSGQKWYETRVYFLSTNIAYTTSLRDETFSGGIVKTSRVTLVFTKKDDQWRIIHGHFSIVPE